MTTIATMFLILINGGGKTICIFSFALNKFVGLYNCKKNCLSLKIT